MNSINSKGLPLSWSIFILSSALTLTACDGSSGGGTNGGSSSPSWSTPVELSDGSVSVNDLKINKAGSKPVIAYYSQNKTKIREFDGSNWSTPSSASNTELNVNISSLDFSSNNKGVITYKLQNGNACDLYYRRYDGTSWANTAVKFRSLGGTQQYSCANVFDLSASALSNGETGLTYNRMDIYNSGLPGRYNHCKTNNVCTTNTTTSSYSLGGNNARAISLSAGSNKSMILSLDNNNSLKARNFDYSGGSPFFQLSANAETAAIAMDQNNNAIAIYNVNSILKGNYYNGADWLSTAIDLGDTVNTEEDDFILEQYMSKTSGYGLSIWNNGSLNDGDGSLRTNLFASNAFESTSTLHSNADVIVARNFTGAINNNGRAVIAWLEYTGDAETAQGTIYARVYDGNQWQSKQTIKTDVNAIYFEGRELGKTIEVHLDDSGNATLVFLALSAQQTNTQLGNVQARESILAPEAKPRLFYTRLEVQ